MEGLIIQGTENTPEVIMEPGGVILIRGRIMKNQEEFLQKTCRWIDEYVSKPADMTCVNIFLEYAADINNSLMLLLRKILRVKLKDKKLLINWYYEEGDEDIQEKGECASAFLGYPFNIIMIADIYRVRHHELSCIAG